MDAQREFRAAEKRDEYSVSFHNFRLPRNALCARTRLVSSQLRSRMSECMLWLDCCFDRPRGCGSQRMLYRAFGGYRPRDSQRIKLHCCSSATGDRRESTELGLARMCAALAERVVCVRLWLAWNQTCTSTGAMMHRGNIRALRMCWLPAQQNTKLGVCSMCDATRESSSAATHGKVAQ